MFRLLVILLVIGSTPCFTFGQDEAGQNRLRLESSPYLRMHANNPVDWYPWGNEALEKAKQENKPIFLSIGFQNCRGCIMMAEESFSDDEIADFLNDHFVSIKVDLDERPDLDSIYMTALVIMQGNAAAPLNAFLTPEGKPFFATTYLPPRPEGQSPASFFTLIQEVQRMWKQSEDDLQRSADRITRTIKQAMGSSILKPELQDLDLILVQLDNSLRKEFDPRFGGFGFDENADLSKSPQPSTLSYLLARQKAGFQDSGKMLRLTLDNMARGSIYDQLGGGFFDKSQNRKWNDPTFEKSLTTNAQLLSLYSQAATELEEPQFAEIAQAIAEFVLQEMRGPKGEFYSALRGESDGSYYRFTLDDIQNALSDDEQKIADAALGLGGDPNFQERFYLPQFHGSGEPEKLTVVKQKLLALRSKRTQVELDQRVNAGWNGLMIQGLADAGKHLNQPRLIDAAEKSARFVLSEMTSEDGRLKHSLDLQNTNAFLDDYAFVIRGLIALYEATGEAEAEWLNEAVRLQELQTEYFADSVSGGFYFTSKDRSDLIIRGKIFMDREIPSGNSVAIENLTNLALLTGGSQATVFRDQVTQAIDASAPILNERPTSVPRLVSVLAEAESEQD